MLTMMYVSGVQELVSLTGIPVGILVTAFIVISIWSLLWKGWALWIAAQNRHVAWFIVLLLVNTVGILEIVYIFAFGKPALSKKARQ